MRRGVTVLVVVVVAAIALAAGFDALRGGSAAEPAAQTETPTASTTEPESDEVRRHPSRDRGHALLHRRELRAAGDRAARPRRGRGARVGRVPLRALPLRPPRLRRRLGLGPALGPAHRQALPVRGRPDPGLDEPRPRGRAVRGRGARLATGRDADLLRGRRRARLARPATSSSRSETSCGARATLPFDELATRFDRFGSARPPGSTTGASPPFSRRTGPRAGRTCSRSTTAASWMRPPSTAPGGFSELRVSPGGRYAAARSTGGRDADFVMIEAGREVSTAPDRRLPRDCLVARRAVGRDRRRGRRLRLSSGRSGPAGARARPRRAGPRLARRGRAAGARERWLRPGNGSARPARPAGSSSPSSHGCTPARAPTPRPRRGQSGRRPPEPVPVHARRQTAPCSPGALVPRRAGRARRLLS